MCFCEPCGLRCMCRCHEVDERYDQYRADRERGSLVRDDPLVAVGR